jgi:hypothetical protein
MRHGFGFSCAALCALLLSAACSGAEAPPSTGPDAGGVDLGKPLLGEGTLSDWCAPDDGPALTFTIGTASTCTVPPGLEQQVHFIVHPGSTSTLAAGQIWSFDEMTAGVEGRAWWYPDGVNAMSEQPESGFVEIVSVSPVDAVVRYSFTLKNDEKYGGEARIWVCPSMQMCG